LDPSKVPYKASDFVPLDRAGNKVSAQRPQLPAVLSQLAMAAFHSWQQVAQAHVRIAQGVILHPQDHNISE